MPQPRRRSGWSIVTRIVGLSFVLLLLVQAAGFAVVRASIDRNARQELSRALSLDERIWLRLLALNVDRLRQGAALLAADYGFRSAVTSDDTETINSALENQGGRIGASVAAFLDPHFVLKTSIGVSESAATGLSAIASAMAPAHSEGSPDVQLIVLQGMPFQFVLVPVRAPLVVGWVLMGFPVTQQLGDEFHALVGVNLAVLAGAPGTPEKLILSTLPPRYTSALGSIASADQEVQTDEGLLLARRISVPTVGGTTHAVLLRSIDAMVAPYRSLQWVLGIITLAGALLFGIGMALMARRVTTPLRSLITGARQLGRGDYGQPVEYTERRDEIGALARSFDQMRVSISEQQAEVRRLAFRDRLTGLPNRVSFREAVQAGISAQRNGGANASEGLAILTLNLDRFKHVNDVLGYPFGDRLLVAVAERLNTDIARPQDTLSRLGGNSFGLLLPHDSEATAMATATRILRSFEKPLAMEEQTVDLSTGIGIARWPDDADDADTLLSRSEMAMYVAKRSTAGVVCYDPALDSASALSLSLLTELRQAIGGGELRLFLQPKIRLSDGAVTGAEALVRWNHPRRGMVPPMEFIPFAEQTGFVRQITGWMLAEASRLWGGLQEPGHEPLRLSVNLSTRDLMDPELALRLPGLLARHGTPTRGLCLEITESAIMDDPKRAENTLNRLAEQGFSLSIDDFGTGYSSLAYLKRLPVNELKIDKSFVLGMQTDSNDATIVRSTIELAHNLGLSVVAEGVETELLYQRLGLLACDEAQGYFMTRPLPADEFSAWRTGWRDGLLVA
jgi:diguanylate cyclase (GGDEF)-like protein